MYLERAKKRFKEMLQELNYPDNAISGTIQEIQEIENKLRLNLPAAYQEYLLWMGNETGEFLEDMCVIGNICETREDAIELMYYDKYPETLPDDAIVINMHQGYHFRFIRVSGGNNPPIHQYYQKHGIEWNQFSNLEEYILNYIEEMIKLLKK